MCTILQDAIEKVLGKETFGGAIKDNVFKYKID